MLYKVLVVGLSASSFSTAIEVSVCRDATYDISVDASLLCAGSGSGPTGLSCPKAGDVAVADCYSYLPSYTGKQCVAPEDAVCQLVHGGDTWGCVLPTVGCNSIVKPECVTWDYKGEDTMDLDSLSYFDGNEEYDESWFFQTTELRDLYNGCGELPTPAPTTAVPTPAPTPAPTTPAPTPAPRRPTTPAPTPAPTPVPTTLAPTTLGSDLCSNLMDGEVKSDYESKMGDKDSVNTELSKVSLASVNASKSQGFEADAYVIIAIVAAVVAVAALAAVYAQKRQQLQQEAPATTRGRRSSIEYDMALTPPNAVTSPRGMTSPRL
ncbi:unnamed protein product [Peronospora belbahrii]|uniref:Carbohydrate-binding protein n=1 Tax=Peronospora belbahrii TaxID=622444 RepID=A0AAU9L7L2_9STRA|nr:unnamed protein product [Peronospora belbahrii]